MIRPYAARDLDELLDVWEQASRLAHPFLDDVFFRRERKAIVDVYLPMTETWVYLVVDSFVFPFPRRSAADAGRRHRCLDPRPGL